MTKPLALIVEDDEDAVLIFNEALLAAGCETEILRTGDGVIEWLASRTPGLVVLDVNLPGLSGLDILEQIASDPLLSRTRVIVVSGYPHLLNLIDGSEHSDRADVALLKPVGYVRLRDLAQRLLQ